MPNRRRFPLRVAQTIREQVPESLPVFVRISATDWARGRWDLPRYPYWANHAAKELAAEANWPVQYLRAVD